jgi:polysaccharide export outer membrane protein
MISPTGFRFVSVFSGVIFFTSMLPQQARCEEPSGSPLQAAALAGLATSPVGADYRLSPRDLVQFEIFEEPETLVIQRVSSSGAISIPMLGLIQVADKTLLEITESTQKAYVARGFYVHPQVLVTVQAYAPRSVSVLGQVNHPEQIALPIEASGIGIMQAITLAQGFTRLARADQVLVMRKVGGREEQHIVNIASYLASRGSEPEFQLRPDDIVFVPERVF